jgi:GDP-L-fucose synthase
VKNKKVLITGANGLVGNHLVDKCISLGAIVTATDVVIPYNQIKKYSQNYEFIQADLREFSECKKIVKDIDVVFHLAGVKGSPKRAIESPADYFVPMLQFNTNLMEAARLEDVEWLVYTSTIGVYNPADIFYEDDVWETFPSDKDKYAGWAKRMGELQSEAYSVSYKWNKISIVRPANIYGPHDNFGNESTVIASLIKRLFGLNENPLICWGDGTPIRDFIYVGDVVDGIIKSYNLKITEPINLGSGDGISIRELAETLINIYKTMYDIDVPIIWDTDKPNGDLKRLMSTDRSESYGIKCNVSLEDGLKRTIEYFNNNYVQKEKF